MGSSSPDRRPVIIGVGQYVHRPGELAETRDALDHIEMAVRRAEEDSSMLSLSQRVDTLCLVNILSRSCDGLPSGLSQRIGAKPRNEAYTWVGATAPQWFVNRTAERIRAGEARLALICGGEAFCSRRLEARAKGTGAWDWDLPPRKPWMAGDLRDPLTSLEAEYGLLLPANVYPLFENALRYCEGLSVDEQREELGEFCSKMSAIAARNPYAWFRESKTSAEIARPSPNNRQVSFPYTKSMCSIMEVDQAAALFLTDVENARALGVPSEKWVYLLGSGDASDIWHVSERVNFHSSPSVKVAAEEAMEQAGISLEEVDYLDFYSCFPCAPRITRRMLGIPKDDPRPSTVTGGMPYFGGPGNDYSLHAICRMVELLREDPARVGLVQALSWFISKHSVGLYSAQGERRPRGPLPPVDHQAELEELRGPAVVEQGSGRVVVETYTLFHDREGRPIEATIIARLDDGARILAKAVKEEQVLTAMTEREFIGEVGKVQVMGGLNVIEF